MNPMDKIILALDFPTLAEAETCLQKLPELTWVKVGMELFYAEGPQVIRNLKDRGYKVFLDLKLHDIPNTVYSATKSLLSLGADMLNYHVAGGKAMLAAAVQASTEMPGKQPILIGVTQLTSTDQITLEREIGITRPLAEVVLSYASLAKETGLHGVVCSALETTAIKGQMGADFITVTPGIRLETADTQDQKRVVTPKQALEYGSDFLVIGRPLTKAAQPTAAWEEIKRQLL